MDFDKVWAPIAKVIEYQNMDYDEAVTIGGQFGKLQAEIDKLEKENEQYREAFDTKNKVHDKLNDDYMNLKSDNERLREIIKKERWMRSESCGEKTKK